MRLRDLKDTLKGTQKRLERAEALLMSALYDMGKCTCQPATPNPYYYDPREELQNKIEAFIAAPLDTSP